MPHVARMILRPRCLFRLAPIGAIAVLVGCASQAQTPQQKAALAACRAQAEQQFTIQNRPSLFQPDNSLTPFAASSQQLGQTRSLVDQFSHGQMVQACLRGATGPAPVAPSGPPAP